MNPRLYLQASGVVFGLVALVHLVRVAKGWALTLGPITVPTLVSVMGIVGPAFLCGWALYCARNRP